MPLSQIKLSKGLAVSVNDFGNPDGYPVMVNHGLIASIRDEYFFSRLVEAGRRIICIARPGYGKTSPFMLANVREWGSVAGQVASELGIGELDVLGISSGAPYSYAVACELEANVRNVFIFSGTPALFHREVASLWPYPLNPEADMAELQTLAKTLFFPKGAALGFNDSEDSYANDCFGIALDLKIRCRDWGFDLSQIRAKTYMEHSADDESVPCAAAEMTAGFLHDCAFLKREGGGHFSRVLLDRYLEDTVLRRKER